MRLTDRVFNVFLVVSRLFKVDLYYDGITRFKFERMALYAPRHKLTGS